MEGELLDLLLHAMYSMERDHKVVCQTHSAYVKNRHPIRPCFKTEHNQGISYVTEFLLIELTYYANKPQWNEPDSPDFQADSRKTMTAKRVTDLDNFSDYLPTDKDSALQTRIARKSVEFHDRMLSPTKLPLVHVPLKLSVEYRSKPSINRQSLEDVLKYSVCHFNRKCKQSASYTVASREFLTSASPSEDREFGARRPSLDLQRLSRDRWNLEHLTETSLAVPSLHQNLTSSSLRQNQPQYGLRQACSSLSEDSSDGYPDLSWYAKEVERLTGHTIKSDDTKNTEEEVLDKWLSDKLIYPKKPFEYKSGEDLVVDKFHRSTKKKLQERKNQRILESETRRSEYEEAQVEFEKSRPKVKPIEDVPVVPVESFSLIKVCTRTPSGVDFIHWVDETDARRRNSFKDIEEEINKKPQRWNKRWTGKSSKRKRRRGRREGASGVSSPTGSPDETGKSKLKSGRRSANKVKDDSLLKANRPVRKPTSAESSFSTEGGFTPGIHRRLTPGIQQGRCTDRIQQGGLTPGILQGGFIPMIRQSSPVKTKSTKKKKKERTMCVHEIGILKRRLKLAMLKGQLEPGEAEDIEDELNETLFDAAKRNKNFTLPNITTGKTDKRPIANLPQRYPEIVKESTAKCHGKKCKTKPILPSMLNEISVEEWQQLSTVEPFKSSQYDDHVTKQFPDYTVPGFKVTATSRDFYAKFQKAMDDFVIRKENVISNLDFKHISSVTFTRHAIFQKGF
ncbi:uncharacterized protein LOC121380024 isoform X2 [Gigantopelta aegis]|nr:uncharacterized protein LOC121380024 isoform X2 [Gigantopelta aegis]